MNIRLFFILLLFGSSVSLGFSQESSNTSGGDASGVGGTAAYSIGQVTFSIHEESDGSVSQGVQQPYIPIPTSLGENIQLVSFPNPVTDYLTLDLLDYEAVNIEYQIVDVRGEIILDGSSSLAETVVDIRGYSKGIYFVKVFVEAREVKSFRIIKN